MRCLPFSVPECTRTTTTLIDNSLDNFDPVNDENVAYVYSLLTWEVSSLLYRFLLLDNIADLRRCVYLIGVALCICEPVEAAEFTMLKYHTMIAFRRYYEHTKAAEDLDRLIDFEEWYSLHAPQRGYDKEGTLIRLAEHLSLRWRTRHNAEDRDRTVHVCKRIARIDEGRSELERAVASIIQSLFDAGGEVVDWRLVVDALDLHPGSSDRRWEDRVAPFLLYRLRVAVLADDEEVANEVEQEIHQRIVHGFLSPRHPVFWIDPDSLDSTIEIFRKRCLSCDPDRELARHQACTLVLLSLLYQRYASRRQIFDIRAALRIRTTSRLGPMGTYCLDILLLSSSASDLDPVGANQRLAEALDLHLSESECSYCNDNLPTKILRGSSAQIRNDKERTVQIPQGQTSLLILVPQLPSLSGHSHGSSASYASTYQCNHTSDPEIRRTELLQQMTHHGEQARLCAHHKAEHCAKALQYSDALRDDLRDGDGEDDIELRDWRNYWAQALLQTNFPGSQSSVPLALDYIRERVNDAEHVPHSQRIMALNYWFKYLRAGWAENRGRVLEMAECALSLLQEQNQAAMNARASMDMRLLWGQGLLLDTVIETVLADNSNLPRAVEILESGQSMVWDRVNQARARGSSHTLSTSQEPAGDLQSSRDTLKSDIGTSHHTYEDYFSAVGNRAIARSTDVLKPGRWEELRGLGCRGPVVLLVPGNMRQQTVVILFLHGTCEWFTIPVSVTKIKKLHQLLRVSARTRGEDDPPSDLVVDVVDCDHDAPDSTVTEVDLDTGTSRSLKRSVTSIDNISAVLKVLWEEVATHVLRAIFRHDAVASNASPEEKPEKFVKPVSHVASSCVRFILTYLGRTWKTGVDYGGVVWENSPLCLCTLLASITAVLRSACPTSSSRHIFPP